MSINLTLGNLVLIIIGVHMGRHAQLADITQALGATRPFLGLGKSGQQQRSQDGDDSDDDEQLDQGEASRRTWAVELSEQIIVLHRSAGEHF
jgi:hypothetical protein